MTCQGVMRREFGAARCYLDLCYASDTVKDVPDLPDVAKEVDALRARLDYSFIRLCVFKCSVSFNKHTPHCFAFLARSASSVFLSSSLHVTFSTHSHVRPPRPMDV